MRNNNTSIMKHTEQEDYDNHSSPLHNKFQNTILHTYHTETGVQFAFKAKDVKTTTRNNNHDNPSFK